jgi:site-specific recombinase XerD
MAPADELLVGRVEDFLAGLQAAKRSAHTIGAYRDDLLGVAARVACQLHGPDARVERLAVSELDARCARRSRPGRLITPRRRWSASGHLQSLLRIPHRRRDPGSQSDEGGPKAQARRQCARAIRQENVAETLLAAAATPDPSAERSKRWSERDVALVAMFCVTGIRLAETIALRLDSITGPSGARRLQVSGKGKKERMIPLQPGLEAVLERYLDSRRERHGSDALTDPAAALLVHYDNTPLTRGRVQYVIEQLYRRGGLSSAVPAGALVHALRDSFASLAIEYGTDVAELRELLGHASLATTSRYLDANTSRLRHAVAAHPSQRALDQPR